MKTFKRFYEDFNIPQHTQYAVGSKDIDFRGATPAGFKGDHRSPNTIQISLKKRIKSHRKFPKGKLPTQQS